MKYSIMEFSQAEITKLNDQNPENKLDFTDLMILQWFKDFSSYTHALHTNKSNKKGMWTRQIDGETYYFVNYNAIIDEFPLLDISSTKSICRKFDKYVACGIMNKKIINIGRKGNYPFFNVTEKFFELIYNDLNIEHKINPHKKEEQITPEKAVNPDKSVQTKTVSPDKSVQTNIYNPTINLRNSATTSEIINSESEIQADSEKKIPAEGVLEKITKLFGYNPNFSPNPYPQLFENANKCGITPEYIPEYLEWIFETLKPTCKNKANFDSYFYKSFTQEHLLAKFWFSKQKDIKAQKEQQSRMKPCPVCGKVHDFADYVCPVCGLSKNLLDSPDDIRLEKAVYHLKISNPEMFVKYNDEVQKLMTKIPLSARLNKTRNDEFNMCMNQLEAEYLQFEI